MNTRSVQFRMASWYTAFLAVFLVLFGIALYGGLRSYLEKTLRASLSQDAEAVTEEITEHDSQGRTSTLASLLSERFAPQLNDRFIRVTDQSGNVVFASAKSVDGALDPALVPPVAHEADQEYEVE